MHIAQAAPERTVPMVAEASDIEVSQPRTRLAAADSAARVGTAETAPRTATREAAIRSDPNGVPTNAPRSGSAEPIQPIPVKTIPVRPRAVQSGTLGALAISPSPATALPYWTPSNTDPAAETHRGHAASEPGAAVAVAANSPAGAATPLPPPPGARPGILGTLPVHSAVAAKDPAPASATLPATAGEQRTTATRGGWIIQLGAFADEAEAKQRLRSAQSMAHELLANAEGFTERFVKGSKEFYRARFAGFDKEKAEAACHYFKRNDIACMTLRN